MINLVNRLQACCPLSVRNALVRLATFCLLLGGLCGPSLAQDVQGLPVVGAGGTSQKSSQMFIDATQFGSGTDDMCTKIADACGALGSSTSYPLGATIDARGFTANQVCSALHITKMLFQCVPQGSSTGATGGKLLLGEVNLYADGPASPATSYTDGNGSGVGTPALIIPAGFWGIEGLSRGANPGNNSTNPPPGPGTFLSVCTGNGTPVNSSNAGPGSPPCHNPFPVRSFVIASTNISTVSGVTTMAITLPDPVTSGTNIYLGELAMVKGAPSTTTAGDNGTYKIQSITNSSGMGTTGTITVTVPSGTPTCALTPPQCGTVFLGTPILGFGPGGTNAYNTPSCAGVCNTFGGHIKTLGFNCQALDGCIGWQNLYTEEDSWVNDFAITQFSFVGFDSHGNLAQNFGPILNAQIATGTSNTNCDFGTTGGYIGDSYMHGFDSWTIGSPDFAPNLATPSCPHMPIAAVMLDAPNTLVSNGHCEAFSNCVLIGANNSAGSGEQVRGVVGPPSGKAGLNVVEISGNYPSNSSFAVENIRNQGGTPRPNTILDVIKNIAITDSFVGSYAWDTNGSLTNLLTTNTSIRNEFDAGVRTGTIASGVSTNTDLAGQCTLVTPTPFHCTYPFTQTYSSTNPPICTCSDTTAINACRVQVSSSTLTITGTTNGDVIYYVCIGRN
jgi:hypothetical protein